MKHKKTTIFFIFIATFIAHQTTMCMDNLNTQKTQAQIDLLKKQLETEEQKKKNKDAIQTEKINVQKKTAEKLQADIDANSTLSTIKQSFADGIGQGVAGGISGTLQHGGKQLIDLWLDGYLTTAEVLIELEKREDILAKRYMNIKEVALTQKQFLTTPEAVTAYNQKTSLKLQTVENEIDRNAALYEQVVSGRGKRQSWCEYAKSFLPSNENN